LAASFIDEAHSAEWGQCIWVHQDPGSRLDERLCIAAKHFHCSLRPIPNPSQPRLSNSPCNTRCTCKTDVFKILFKGQTTTHNPHGCKQLYLTHERSRDRSRPQPFSTLFMSARVHIQTQVSLQRVRRARPMRSAPRPSSGMAPHSSHSLLSRYNSGHW
jgi:hypothetical protein